MALSFPREKHMGVRCLLRLQALVRPFSRTIEECRRNVPLPSPVKHALTKLISKEECIVPIRILNSNIEMIETHHGT